MAPATPPATAAMLDPECVGVVVCLVGILVWLAGREAARVEGRKARKAVGMGTLTP
jgi:hypothetical protein